MNENSNPNTTPAPPNRAETTSTNNIEIVIDAEGNVVLSDLPADLLPLLDALGSPHTGETATLCSLYPDNTSTL